MLTHHQLSEANPSHLVSSMLKEISPPAEGSGPLSSGTGSTARAESREERQQDIGRTERLVLQPHKYYQWDPMLHTTDLITPK